MCDPVELRMATVSSFPTGTGSFAYRQRFEIITREIGSDESVLVCGENGEHAARRTDRLHDGRTRWRLETSFAIYRFSIRYDVAGVTFWDGNEAMGYSLPLVADSFAALLGKAYPLVLGAASLFDGWLTVIAAVRNMAYEKEVGVLYSTDDWATSRPSFARYRSTQVTGTEVWTVRTKLERAERVAFALFLRASGAEHWDNNFGANYVLASGTGLPVEP